MMTWGALDSDGNIVRDPTFPDIPSFKEVCEATKGCKTSGDAWEAWKAFFIAGFPAQKMIFLPNGAPEEAIATYSKAIDDILARPDFPQISENNLGIYPQMTGKQAKVALKMGTDVPDGPKAYVKTWLKERFGVELK